MRSSLVLIVVALVVSMCGPASGAKIKEVNVSLELARNGIRLKLGAWAAGAAAIGVREVGVVPSSIYYVRVDASSGKWVGVSFRDCEGTVYDVSAHKTDWRGKCDAFQWAVPTNLPEGRIEMTIALWQDYDAENDRMVGELDRMPWSYVGTYMGGY